MTVFFLLLCVLFLLAAYAVVRTVLNLRKSYHALLSRVAPLSDQARGVLTATTATLESPMPNTWLEVSDLMKIRRNSAVFTMLADRFRRILAACTDQRSIAAMDLTYRTFLRNHWRLTRSLMAAIVHFCFGKIAKERCSASMAIVARCYTNEVFLIEEMSEVMGTPTVVLEGQFLHGT